MNLSVSKLKQYFYFNQCHKFLENLLNEIDNSHKSIQEKYIEEIEKRRGEYWETVIRENILERTTIAIKEDGDKTFSFEDFKSWLVYDRKEFIEEVFVPFSDMLIKDYDRFDITFQDCRIDLIRKVKKDEKYLLSVIEIKSSDKTDKSHIMQVAIYAYMLQMKIEELGLKDKYEVDFKSCGVWKGKNIEQDNYDVSRLFPVIDKLFNDDIKNVISNTYDNTPNDKCHSPKCRMCKFFSNCYGQLNRANIGEVHISLIPGLTRGMINFLASKLRERDLDENIINLYTLISEDEAFITCLRENSILKYQIKSLRLQTEALLQGKIKLTGKSVYNISDVKEDISIFISVYKDRITKEVVAAAIQAVCYDQRNYGSNFGTGSRILVCQQPLDIEINKKKFVDELYELFENINWNTHDSHSQLSVKMYVSDEEQYKNLLDLIFSVINNDVDEATTKKAKILVYYMHSEANSSLDSNPVEFTDTYPVVMLSKACNRLFAYPLVTGYKFKDIYKVMQTIKSERLLMDEMNYEFDTKYNDDTINLSLSINRLWRIDSVEYKRKTNRKIIKLLCKNILMSREIIDMVRELNSLRAKTSNELLVGNNVEFKIPVENLVQEKVISKLIFFSKYESLLQCNKIKEKRALSREDRLEGSTSFIAAFEDHILKPIDPEFRYKLKNDLYFIASPDTALGEMNQTKFNDYLFRNMSSNFGPHISGVNSAYLKQDREGEYYFNVDYNMQENIENYICSVRFYDPMTNIVINGLGQIDTSSSAIVRFIRSIINRETISKYNLNYKNLDKDIILKESKKLKLTESQQDAFIKFMNNSLTVLWGPPGTGKTHFIADALLLMLKLLEDQDCNKLKNLIMLIREFKEQLLKEILLMNGRLLKLKDAIEKESFSYKLLRNDYNAYMRDFKAIVERHLETLLRYVKRFVDGLNLPQLFSVYNRFEEEVRKLKFKLPYIPLTGCVIQVIPTIDGYKDIMNQFYRDIEKSISYFITRLKKSYQIKVGYNILITGATNTAIDNCLEKIEVFKGNVILADHISVKKVGRPSSIENDNLERCNNIIRGATPYHVAQTLTNVEFDVIVIDEGSQMKLPEALIILSKLKKDGKLLVVGDHYQLPPLIHGDYNLMEDQKIYFLSVFEFLYRFLNQSDSGRIGQLTESWRMNRTLCSYSSKELYLDKLKPATNQVATQKLYFNTTCLTDDFLRFVLSPEFPLVVCVMEEGIYSCENSKEARATAKLTRILWENLRNDKNERYQDLGYDKFFEKGVSIIAPHYVQIHEIKKELVNEGITCTEYVNTIEKIQGRESQVTIISYGVGDSELAISEGDFIYSTNRLNVSITRAKEKTILFINKKIIEKDYELLADYSIAEGFDFMTNLVEYCKNPTDAEGNPMTRAGADTRSKIFSEEGITAYAIRIKK